MFPSLNQPCSLSFRNPASYQYHRSGCTPQFSTASLTHNPKRASCASPFYPKRPNRILAFSAIVCHVVTQYRHSIIKPVMAMDTMVRSFFLGFIKIHILHHASQEPVYGLWLIEELRRHGYMISPGTLYPIFHSLEKDGMLHSHEKVVEGKVRKYYRTTARGNGTLKEAKIKVRELLQEIIEE